MRPIITAACLWCCVNGEAFAAPASPLRLVKTIALAGVEGRMDHMALDSTGQRLFMVALGNNTVEVLDLRAGRRVRTLTGFSEPQVQAMPWQYCSPSCELSQAGLIVTA